MPARSTARASSEGLEIVRKAIAQKGWRKTSPVFSDAACVSTATLKRFWRGIPISQASFEGICQSVSIDVAVVAEKNDDGKRDENSAQSDPGARNYSDIWIGRTDTVKKLTTRLQADTRILTLVGLTGIGKTALARYIACRLSGYTCIHIRCNQQNPPTLASLAHAISQQNNLAGVKLNIFSLLSHIKQSRYLFIIDALEGLLHSNNKTGFTHLKNKLWYKFFQAVLAADSCSSRIILTSQVLPNELDELGENYPERWHLQVLSGLNIEEQYALFKALNITFAEPSHEADYISAIACAYAGHPAAIRAIAQDIILTFNHNIAAYWNEYQQKNAIAPLHTRHLRKRLQPKLNSTLQQLKEQLPAAYALLHAACSRYPDIHTAGELTQHWLQLAQTLAHSDSPLEDSPLEDSPLEDSPSEDTASGLRAASLWVDALCDRNIVAPIVINNRLHYRVHPLIHSLIAAH